MPFSGFQDLDPNFSSSLQAMIAERPGIFPNSGYRSVERQRMLWNRALQKYGSPKAARKWVAPPGRSRHNMRLAVDLGYKSAADKAWAHANAARFGLRFPMGHEPWHIEPAGGRSAVMSASAPSGNDKPLQVTADGSRSFVNKDMTTLLSKDSLSSMKPKIATTEAPSLSGRERGQRTGLGGVSQALADAAAQMGTNEAAWSWVQQAMAPRSAQQPSTTWLGRPIWL